MRSLQSRLSRLETAARRTRSELVNDEEVMSALERWDWDSRHLDAMFRVVEPGMLGYALVSSARWRPVLVAGEDTGEPIEEFDQMCFLIALGSDILHPVRRELEFAKRYLTKPLRNDEEERTGNSGQDAIHDAQAGLVRRLFQKHGLQELQSIVSEFDDGPEHQQLEFLTRFVPRVDQARWNRMTEMVQPLDTLWGHIGLLARSSDGREVWSRDRHGEVRTREL